MHLVLPCLLQIKTGTGSEYDYDVFGALLGMKGSLGTRYLFTGQEFDAESSLYYYNARYYNPRLGRFISRDTYLGEDGDILSRNRYVYVKNNPLKFMDPTGGLFEEINNYVIDVLDNAYESSVEYAGQAIDNIGGMINSVEEV